MLNTFVFSEAKDKDMRARLIEAAAEIEKSCFSAFWTSLSLSELLANSNYNAVFSVDNDEIVGYAIFSCIAGEAELLRIAVLPQKQNSGIGKHLMNSLNDLWEKADVEKAFLEVRKSNLRAAALYEKFGFEKIHIRKQYYDDGEDAVIYQRVV